MSTVISITDRDDLVDWNRPTDNIVVAQGKSLTWIPRDLWIPSLPGRINECFRRGRHLLLVAALHELGFPVKQSICLSPMAIAPLIEKIAVTVPVPERMEFLYPKRRELPIESGSRVVVFKPPTENLFGEKVHHWIGARTRADGKYSHDLDRIERQKVLVGELLSERFSFSNIDRSLCHFYREDAGWGDFASVSSLWTLKTYQQGNLKEVVLMGQKVLVPNQ